jgi:phosphatidylinositol glycan class T
MSLFLLLLFLGQIFCDKFSEELLINPLQSGHLNTHFKFTVVHPADIRESVGWTHYDLFPRPLGELLGVYQVQELSLSLTQGQWRYGSWGYPVESSPPGAMILARFLPSVSDVDRSWEGLTNALAGLLCASLNKLDRTQGVQPVHTFHPAGLSGSNLTSSTSHLRYGLLPKENLCTENLTPWKKLLPCKAKRGLSILLNSGVVQKHSSYQSLLLKIRPVCGSPDCESVSTELSQSISLVFDPAVYNGQADRTDWNLKHLFGIGVSTACPMADTSQIFVDISGGSFQLSPVPDREVMTGSGKNVRTYGVFDVKTFSPDGRIKNLSARHSKPHIYGIVHSPALTATRHITGAGQEFGGIRATIKNMARDPITVVYLDIVPWYLRLYLHTLKITVNSEPLKPIHTHYSPGVDRARPYHLELVLKLPARSTTVISIQFEHSMLRWVEYPPDANHGFYVGSATITARIPDNRNATLLAPEDSTLSFAIWGNPPTLNTVVHIFTEILLVSLPTPDFSMPYNVICLACTVAALAFGPIHNITTKSLLLVQPGQEEKGLLGKIFDKTIGRILEKIKTLKEKKSVPAEDTQQSSEAPEENEEHSEVNDDEIED